MKYSSDQPPTILEIKDYFTEFTGIELHDLPIASERKNQDRFLITVRDREEWDKQMERLLPYFGAIIYEEYERKPFDINNEDIKKRALYQLDLTFKGANRVYVISNGTTVIGFISIEYHDQDKSVGIVRDIIVNSPYRNQRLSRKLYNLVFKNESDITALIGFSKTPQAVKARLTEGEKYGYQGFFWRYGISQT